MKKKSILLLLVAMTLSLVFGLVGCTTVTIGGTESGKVEISEEDKAQFSLIVEENAGEQVLSNHSTYLVSYDFEEGDMAGYQATYFFNVSESEISADYCFTDSTGKVISAANLRKDCSYTLMADGKCELGIYPNGITKEHVLALGQISFEDQELTSNIELDGEKLTFSTASIGETIVGVSYDWEVDYATLLINNVRATSVDSEGNVIDKVLLSFNYGLEGYEPDITAYEKITDQSVEQVKLTVLYKSKATDSEKTEVYTVAIGTNIVFNATEGEESYLFYENAACTRDIENVGEYLEYYKDLFVYAGQGYPQFSFAFTLCEADVEEMQNYIDLFVQMVEENYSINDIENVRAGIEDKMAYFVHMYYMGQIQYYNDITREKGKQALNYAMSTYNDMYAIYIDAYKVVYEMDESNAYRQYFFEGWTEEDFAIFEQDNEAIAELEEANSLLEQEYNALDVNDSNWSTAVEEIYVQFVANNQELAKLNGYDNAYDYLSETTYKRYYSDEEREAYHRYFKEYVVPMNNQASSAWSALKYNQDDINSYYKVMEDNVKKLSNKYIGGYIKSFDNSLQQKMKNMYEKEATRFAISVNSMGTAFANYSSYYGEAFTFFGNGYQDIFTIIHEMGHYISFESYSLSNMGYDLAETHSQGNEWLLLYYIKDKTPSQKVYEMISCLNLVNNFGAIVRSTVVDEFEYRVYTAEEPVQVGEFKEIMRDIFRDFGLREVYLDDYYGYGQKVMIGSPVYYLNYATSGIAAMGFYAIADIQGYDVAQEVYRALQEDCDIYKPYGQILQDIGLSSPFEEQTYIDLQTSFFPEEE